MKNSQQNNKALYLPTEVCTITNSVGNDFVTVHLTTSIAYILVIYDYNDFFRVL